MSAPPTTTSPARPAARATRLATLVPMPAGAGLARMLVERNITSFRHGWIALVTGFAEPVFYLFSLGIGIGALVQTVDDRLRDRGVLPAVRRPRAAGRLGHERRRLRLDLQRLLQAALRQALRRGAGDADGPARHRRRRDRLVADPRGLYSAAFLVVALLAGAVGSWWALLALPAAVFIGFAFAALGMFATTFMKSWVHFDYITLAIQPMFLFSATFFPLSTYPEALQWLVRLTPLYHGVALERALMLGEVGWGVLAHVGYLVVLGAVGVVGTARRLEKLLLS